ncbi:expressed protein [Dictyostelium purpureum]|uniref:Expressed protein n=1 Tax=Dictyostelium purpureum TaxID=5786 RepID=F0ZPM1_DICPU|nr:uncharacterized protein DICPUDRAFT_94880 [Dictyostelium purpureum]EGC34122.1 expressed protein [Dictyostelium purpureum]|eukprot:XP_003289368.1 expressed protein [Dictyostelium purpureum]
MLAPNSLVDSYYIDLCYENIGPKIEQFQNTLKSYKACGKSFKIGLKSFLLQYEDINTLIQFLECLSDENEIEILQLSQPKTITNQINNIFQYISNEKHLASVQKIVFTNSIPSYKDIDTFSFQPYHDFKFTEFNRTIQFSPTKAHFEYLEKKKYLFNNKDEENEESEEDEDEDVEFEDYEENFTN